MSAKDPSGEEPGARPGKRLLGTALAVLDGVILAYAIVLVAYLVFGGVDLGFLSARRFSPTIRLQAPSERAGGIMGMRWSGKPDGSPTLR